MEALDVEIAAEYLVIAATLLFLKSRAAVAADSAEFVDEEEETPEEVEERLRRRLDRVLEVSRARRRAA